jgi:hypothetical protein
MDADEAMGAGWWADTDEDVRAAFGDLVDGLERAGWPTLHKLCDVQASGDVGRMRQELTAFEVVFSS